MPVRMLTHDKRLALDQKNTRLDRAFRAITDKKRTKLKSLMAVLDAINPENVLKRGYSVVYKGDALLKNAIELKKGDEIIIRMQDACVSAEVKSVKE
mgnify:CR=1 FL=1